MDAEEGPPQTWVELAFCRPLQHRLEHQIEPVRLRDFGGRGGTRTPDPLLAKQVLCQLSYTPTAGLSLILEHLRPVEKPQNPVRNATMQQAGKSIERVWIQETVQAIQRSAIPGFKAIAAVLADLLNEFGDSAHEVVFGKDFVAAFAHDYENGGALMAQ